MSQQRIYTQGSGPLQADNSVVLDAAGNGQFVIGPVPAGRAWDLARMTTNCTGTNNPMPVLKVYDGEAIDANFIDGTYTGGLDASDFVYTLSEAEYVTFVYTGGVPGSTATGRLVGTLRSV